MHGDRVSVNSKTVTPPPSDIVVAEQHIASTVNLLQVTGIAHLECVSAVPDRALETFTRLCAGTPTEDSTTQFIRLPGSDDPTLSITAASPNASLVETGLRVFFAVKDLHHVRKILLEESIAFTSAAGEVLGDVLHLDGDLGGYPMAFVKQQTALSSATATASRKTTPLSILEPADVKQLDHCKGILIMFITTHPYPPLSQTRSSYLMRIPS
jgi:hypothetical protein